MRGLSNHSDLFQRNTSILPSLLLQAKRSIIEADAIMLRTVAQDLEVNIPSFADIFKVKIRATPSKLISGPPAQAQMPAIRQGTYARKLPYPSFESPQKI